MRWTSKCGDFFMGLCLSCRKARLSHQNHHQGNSNSAGKQSAEYISSSATPLNACGSSIEENGEDVSFQGHQQELQEIRRTLTPPEASLDDDANLEVSENLTVVVAASASYSLAEQNGGTENHVSTTSNHLAGSSAAGYKNKMANPIKGLVSKRKKRYTQDGFNLDLTYINNNLIAMGFPAEKLEGVFRNHIHDVQRFLESKHKDHYKIYNLCSERSYDIGKFHGRVSTYPFDDHNPPKIELIGPFCADVHQWISQDPKNIAVVHCKAGKGRTGVMICCYMLHSRQFEFAHDALSYYGRNRTHDDKGVTIPSQRRYVDYYAQIIKHGLEYRAVRLRLEEIRLDPLPYLNGMQGNLMFVVSDSKGKIHTSSQYETKRSQPSLSLPLNDIVHLTGDIKIDFFIKNAIRRKEKLFHFWFNTFFVRDEVKRVSENGNNAPEKISPLERTGRAMSCDEQTREVPNLLLRQTRTSSLVSLEPDSQNILQLTIDKWSLDDAHKDKHNKIYPANFKVTLVLTRVPDLEGGPVSNNSLWNSTSEQEETTARVSHDTRSVSSEDEQTNSDTSDEGEDWESVDSAERKVGRYRLLSEADYHQSGESTHL